MRDAATGPPAARLYDALLRAYPAGFRARFGAGMRDAFVHEYAAARARGRMALARFWCVTAWQALALGLAERWTGPRPFDQSPEGPTMFSPLASEFRDALRALRGSPGITVTALLSLALGIGANTALFSILNSLVLRSLPVRDPHQLVLLDTPWTNPLWEAIRAREREFSAGAFAWSNERFDLAGSGVSEFVDGAFISGGMFEVLGTRPALGRLVTPADDVRGRGEPVAVITHEFWRRRFGGAPDIVGRSLTVQRVPLTIIGVTPPGFFGPDVGRSADVMVPLAAEPILRGAGSRLDGRSTWWLNFMARM
jgi:hypothetical protein